MDALPKPRKRPRRALRSWIFGSVVSDRGIADQQRIQRLGEPAYGGHQT